MSDPRSTPAADPGDTEGAAPGPTAPLPVAEGGPPLDRLDPRAITRWRIGYTFRGASFVVFALAAELIVDPPLATGLLALLLAVIAGLVAVFLPKARYRTWRYSLRDRDLYLRYGVLFRTTTIVPHARIQHVDTRHGPIDRYLGLEDVVVFTAGTRGAVIAIPALGAATAEALRDRLAALSGAGDAV